MCICHLWGSVYDASRTTSNEHTMQAIVCELHKKHLHERYLTSELRNFASTYRDELVSSHWGTPTQ